ncbi:type II toxin-antitoxin system YafQ family toxin [Olivibacter ginsenosidimutans]|uniref:Type II toxin-antitoxin system YafQ family toxin n=1 Tax=Olivibacter ginsenosidimutans TaxID=1176537 RepID=A0ABP9BXT8_9SPHI
MYSIFYSNKIKKDIRLAQKRGLNIALFKAIIQKLENNEPLPVKHKPHKLTGNYNGLWECHIQPDWLLIWEQNDEIKLISLIRTGTHADLF